MPITIDIEKDYLYQLGIQQERERVKKERTKLLEATKRLKEEQEKTAKRLKEEQEKTAKRLKEEQEKVYQDKKRTIAMMSKAGIKQEMITIFLNLSIDKIQAFLKEMEKDKSE